MYFKDLDDAIDVSDSCGGGVRVQGGVLLGEGIPSLTSSSLYPSHASLPVVLVCHCVPKAVAGQCLMAKQ